MYDFFSNIWTWVLENSKPIMALLTPANLILLIGAVVTLFKQKKVITANTGESKELIKTLKASRETADKVDALYKRLEALDERTEGVSDEVNQCLAKLNAVLDVQQTAYARNFGGTSTYDAILKYISEGKFAEPKSKAAINEEMKKLQQKIAELSLAGEAAEKKVKKITSVEPKEKPSAGVRYD